MQREPDWRGKQFFTQFVRFGAWERHLQPSQHRKEGLGNPVGADAGTGIGGLRRSEGRLKDSHSHGSYSKVQLFGVDAVSIMNQKAIVLTVVKLLSMPSRNCWKVQVALRWEVIS